MNKQLKHYFPMSSLGLRTHATYVNISAMRSNFRMKLNATFKQYNTHFTTKVSWNISKNDKIMLFEPANPYFSAFLRQSVGGSEKNIQP